MTVCGVRVERAAPIQPVTDDLPFNVKTAAYEYTQLVYEAAADLIHQHNQELSVENVLRIASALVLSDQIYVQESVTINGDDIDVCVDASNLDDQDTVLRVCRLYVQAKERLKGMNGTIYFGERLRFPLSSM